MGFFLVGRVADEGTLRLITPTEFESRQAAIDELSRMTVDPALESEVHVVDLETATPILIVAQQAAEHDAPASKPSDDLADALRRAAGALEDEGIQAPESIGMPAPDIDESPEEPAEPLPVDEPADDSWPWTAEDDKQSKPEVDVSAPSSEEYVIDPLEEPSAADDDGIVVHAIGDVNAIGPARTVVMGAYADSGSSVDQDVIAPDEEPPPPPPVTEDVEPVDESSAVEPMGEMPPPPPPAVELEVQEPDVPSGILEDLEIPDTPSEPETAAFEANDIDLAALACDDCVYVNTCPNKDERDPGNCGSFQWKSG